MQRAATADLATDGGSALLSALGWLWLLPLVAAIIWWLRTRPWRERGGRVPTVFGVVVLLSGAVELFLHAVGSVPSFSFTIWAAAVFVLALVLDRRPARGTSSVAEPASVRPRAPLPVPPEIALDLSLEQAADAIACTDLEGTVIYVNRAWADMHRMTASEARGHHLSLFHTPDQMAREVRPLIDEVLAGDTRTATIGHRRKDGTTIAAETSLALVRDPAGNAATLMAIARERHDRAQAEPPEKPAAAHSDLLVAARTIAHDFNNLLTAVLGNASLALLQLPEDSKVRGNIEEIERVAQRANELSRQLQSQVHGNGDRAPAPVAADEPAPVPAPEPPPASKPPSAGDTILVVDNEKIIRDVATSILESHGYAVLTADDGAPAVALYRQRRKEVGAILLDLTMPHMDGREALREIRRFDPRPPVILMTGHHEQDVRSGFGDSELAAFIQKPFRPDELLGTVRKVLTG